METLETMLACIYPLEAGSDSDSEDEGVCSLTGCVGDIAILDEGIVEDSARRPDAVEMKELTAWSRERLNKLKRHRSEALKLRSVLLRFR